MDPLRPSDFCLISLYNAIYKIITKVISNRLSKLLSYIISNNSFIAGRNTTDNVIVLQEVVHSMNTMSEMKRFMVIKLDLAKAYDKMEWSFIRQSLELLHFP